MGWRRVGDCWFQRRRWSPLSINVFSLITKRSSVAGWYSGTAKDSQDTLEFSALSGVHPMIEKYPLDRELASLPKNPAENGISFPESETAPRF